MNHERKSTGRLLDVLAVIGGFAGAFGMGFVLYWGSMFMAMLLLPVFPFYSAMAHTGYPPGFGMITQAAPYALLGTCLTLVYVWIRRSTYKPEDVGFRFGAGMVVLAALGSLIPCANDANRLRDAEHKTNRQPSSYRDEAAQ